MLLTASHSVPIATSDYGLLEKLNGLGNNPFAVYQKSLTLTISPKAGCFISEILICTIFLLMSRNIVCSHYAMRPVQVAFMLGYVVWLLLINRLEFFSV